MFIEISFDIKILPGQHHRHMTKIATKKGRHHSRAQFLLSVTLQT